MTELLILLYWCTVTLALGCLVALILPVRRIWLILAMALLLTPFFLPPFIRDDGSALGLASLALLFVVYLASWTAGVFAGSGLRRRGLQAIRAARLRRSASAMESTRGPHE